MGNESPLFHIRKMYKVLGVTNKPTLRLDLLTLIQTF